MSRVRFFFYFTLLTLLFSISYWILFPGYFSPVLRQDLVEITRNVTTFTVLTKGTGVRTTSNVSGFCRNVKEAMKRRDATLPHTFYSVDLKDLYVFSAFGDSRFGNLIRLIGVGIRKSYAGLKCQFLENAALSESVATVEYVPEGHGLKYDAVFITCRRTLSSAHKTHVGLVNQECAISQFYLPIQVIPPSPAQPQGISLCLPPMQNKYNDVNNLIEFVELNWLLGVKKFVVYNVDIGPDVTHVLRKYEANGTVTVIPWKLPVRTGSMYPYPKHYQIHYYGQMAAIQDCLYRVMNQPYRLAVFQDLDEFLIPKVEANLQSLADKLIGEKNSVRGLSFANAKFALELWDSSMKNERDATIRKYNVKSMLLTQRYRGVLKHGDRSKMLVDTSHVVTMGIHFVWRYLKGKSMHLNSKTALLHHYRTWGKQKALVKDEAALRFKSQLLKNLQTAHANTG